LQTSADQMDTRGKIVGREALRAELESRKLAGQRIVFANGCFDLLHVGHVRYLEAARREGGVLVVGVNADESVRRLKDESRPLLPQQARAELVAALAAVDFVVVFPEDDVAALLGELRPDVHAKGTDYTPETVPEREAARRLGIRIAIVGDEKRHSTRALLDQLHEGAHG
jgi:rfaE bifunctional protein nucleotidyltransferase chain/domain